MGNKQNKTTQNATKQTQKKVDTTKSKEDAIKMLLLGVRSAGKSTIFQAMLFAHGSSPSRATQPYLETISTIIRDNCVEAMMDLHLRSVGHRTHPTVPITIHDLSDTIYDLRVADWINQLWELDAIQSLYKNRIIEPFWFRCDENMDHFFGKIHQIMDESYEPTQEDVLLTRTLTTGLYEDHFVDDEAMEFTIFDVGGQGNERRKWWRCFYKIDCVLFVCGLTGYCTPHEVKSNEMSDSLDEFACVANSSCFKDVQIVLLLNKTDLFRKCLEIAPLTTCFGSEYKGKSCDDLPPNCENKICERLLSLVMDGVDVVCMTMDIISIIEEYCDVYHEYWMELVYRDGIEFITNMFLEIRSNTVVYQVCAVDTQNIKHMIHKVKKQVHWASLTSNILVS